jgi:hypothetical protein
MTVIEDWISDILYADFWSAVSGGKYRIRENKSGDGRRATNRHITGDHCPSVMGGYCD